MLAITRFSGGAENSIVLGHVAQSSTGGRHGRWAVPVCVQRASLLDHVVLGGGDCLPHFRIPRDSAPLEHQ